VDVRAGLEVLAGWHHRDPRSVTAVLTDAEPGERFRIAVMADPPGGTTHPGIAGSVRSAADRLADAGHDVVEATPPDYERVIELWTAVLIGDIRAQRDLFDSVMGPEGKQIIANFDTTAAPTTIPEALLLHEDRYRIMRAWSEFFVEHPILLCPTWAQPAFPHDADLDRESGAEMMTNTIRPVTHANLLGTPSAITPVGLADGLPVGIQVMGDRFTDLRCLTVAAEIESLVGTLTPIDPAT
jgi:amidase